MKLRVTRASDYKYSAELEINNLRQLKDFIDDEGPIILENPDRDDAEEGFDLSLMIYDGYIE